MVACLGSVAQLPATKNQVNLSGKDYPLSYSATKPLAADRVPQHPAWKQQKTPNLDPDA